MTKVEFESEEGFVVPQWKPCCDAIEWIRGTVSKDLLFGSAGSVKTLTLWGVVR